MKSPFVDIGDGYSYASLDMESIVDHGGGCWTALTAEHDSVVFCGHGNARGELSYAGLHDLQVTHVIDAIDAYLDMETEIPVYIIACFPKRVRRHIGETDRVKVVGGWDREVYAPISKTFGIVGVYPQMNLPV